MGGGGVDGAIHRAGGPAILEECKQIVARQGRLPTGKAVITSGGNLKARFVIHTVGPIWHGGNQGEPELLARAHRESELLASAYREPELLAGAYRESLKLAAENNLKSISFPSISTGAYGYPLPEAAGVAIKTVANFLNEQPGSIKEVAFVLFNSDAFAAYSAALSRIARD